MKSAFDSSSNSAVTKFMRDSTVGWLTASGNYYVRRYRLTPKRGLERPEVRRWTHIAYYTLDGERIQLAKAQCASCGHTIESKTCGDYVGCPCGDSAVDTDWWFPERHRYIGKAIPYNGI